MITSVKRVRMHNTAQLMTLYDVITNPLQKQWRHKQENSVLEGNSTVLLGGRGLVNVAAKGSLDHQPPRVVEPTLQVLRSDLVGQGHFAVERGLEMGAMGWCWVATLFTCNCWDAQHAAARPYTNIIRAEASNVHLDVHNTLTVFLRCRYYDTVIWFSHSLSQHSDTE